MGDDEKYYTVQVKGTAYRFRPIPNEDFERVALIQSLSTDVRKIFGALSMVLSQAAVDDAWSKLLDRYVAKEITVKELTTDILGTLVDRQSADEKKRAKASKGPKGLDVASATLVPADAE